MFINARLTKFTHLAGSDPSLALLEADLVEEDLGAPFEWLLGLYLDVGDLAGLGQRFEWLLDLFL